jgi:hypothetical protein
VKQQESREPSDELCVWRMESLLFEWKGCFLSCRLRGTAARPLGCFGREGRSFRVRTPRQDHSGGGRCKEQEKHANKDGSNAILKGLVRLAAPFQLYKV